MLTRKKNTNQAATDQIDPTLIIIEDEPTMQQVNAFNDRPPSYRMTWRRSFLKRFKNRSDFPIEGDNEGDQNPSAPCAPRADELKLNDSEAILDDQTTQETLDEQFIKTYEEVLEVGKVSRKNSNGQLLDQQNSLPTYDEALEIIRSQNDLSQN